MKRNGVTVKVVPFSLTENNTSVHINVDTNVGESDRLFAVDGTLESKNYSYISLCLVPLCY